MKKTLVLASLLAAFGAASAQSSVTLYGVADAYVGQSNFTTTVGGVKTNGITPMNATATTSANNGVAQSVINSGGQYGSRWGIKGSESLGNGLNAIFQFEQGLGLDKGTSGEGAATGFSRQQFAGLSGGFGSLTFGRQYTSYDSARGGFDTHGHSAFSATGGIWNGTGRDYLYRLNNSVRFDSANLSGLTFSATYGVGEDKTSTTAATSVVSVHAKYAAGPLAVALAIQSEKGAAGAVAGSGGSSNFWNNTGSTKETHTLLTGSYNFGVAKLNVGFNTSKDNGAGNTKEKEVHVGVNVPFGANSIDLAYATGKENTVYKASGVGFHYNYALSPRTTAYVGLYQGKVNDPTSTAQAKKSLSAVGFRHAF